MSQKYIVQKPITVRSAPLVLTDEQLARREGVVKPAVDEDGEQIEGVYVPVTREGVQFKAGEVVEFHEEAEKVLIANEQLKEVSDSEAEEFLEEQKKARAAQQTSPSEFQRRPVPDRSGSPNAVLTASEEDLRNMGLSREEFDSLPNSEKRERLRNSQQQDNEPATDEEIVRLGVSREEYESLPEEEKQTRLANIRNTRTTTKRRGKRG